MRQKSWIRLLVWIRGLNWDQTHHLSKFHGNPCSSFCVILLTNQATLKCAQAKTGPPWKRKKKAIGYMTSLYPQHLYVHNTTYCHHPDTMEFSGLCFLRLDWPRLTLVFLPYPTHSYKRTRLSIASLVKLQVS